MKNFHQVTKDLNFVILYGSQLGQAKSISEGLVDVALREHDLKTALFSLNDVDDILDLPKLKIPIVIVTSTTGDGDPPENADKFWRKIRRKNLSSNSLLLVRYAILGLGDTNFNNFCNCGKTIHKQFQELGATLFYPPAWADDGTGLDIVVEDWIQGLWPALKKSLGIFKLSQLCNTSNDNSNSSSVESSFQANKLSNQSEVTSSFLVKSSEKPINTLGTRESTDNLTLKERNNKSTQVKSNLGLGNEMEKENKSSESSVSNVKIDPQPIGAATTTTTTAITKTLTLPPKPASSVILEFGANKSDRNSYDKLNPPAAYPLIDGSPLEANISGAKLLTKNNSVKTTVQVTLDLGEKSLDYEPGDSVGIICPNPASEINLILKHLGLEENSDVEVSIKLNPSVAKGKIPLHLPKQAVSLRDYFTWVCDIRSPPKKAFLRLLAENTSDEGERSILLELCSKEGAKLYTEKIFDPAMSLLDIFLAYPTCKPPVEALLEHLPRLQPRAYSICSSPYSNARESENSENSISRNSFNVAFNIIEIRKDKARQYNRLGVASGWMFNFCRKNRLFGDNFDAEFENDFINSVELKTEGEDTHNQGGPVSNTVVIYKRKNQNFRLPSDLTKSVIMVGPGTGVAPFIGFLEHREYQRKQNGGDIGKIYLYFGCRNRDKDFLYEEELTAFVDSGLLTKLYVTFSRDDGPEQSSGVKYVQDLIKKNEEEVVSPLLDEEGYLYVCGDEKNMAKDVRETLAAAIEHVKGLDSKDAMANIANLVMSKRYLQDLWA